MDFVSDYVLVDIETTGLDNMNDEIIEIGALLVKNDEVVDTFSMLIKPSCLLDDNIINLTHITNEMLDSASDVREVLFKFDSFIGNNILIAHNARFDIGFLRVNFERHLNKKLSNNYIDTLFLARKYVKGLVNYKLGTLSEHFDVDYSGAHRGLVDCMITKQVYDEIKKIALCNV